ncbi:MULTISPECIES: phage virion morphogenesis protein [Halomonas]|uniref:Virion morphogenesis protein n=1 Tax=Halomonas halophila TaxID=29573 RepID=A0ABQ0TZB0_9GAMM|nr:MULTISPECIES: phage virion morphogenesis protein [Halomonas]MDR5889643.1 phage virion morphogenesis protein [Halomonas salina]WJY06325.1 phage virion morphogenesis protein [Halomonas halophila]GEK71588.1 virion morphogenesis protein [Halomonas halophila]
MAGARIQFDIAARPVLVALGELLDRVEDPRPAFREIGEYLDMAHRDRWDAQKAPDGTPWAPLSEATQARKKKNRDKILVRDGYLRDLLRYDVSLEALLFGTDRKYGAVHQFGAERGAFGQASNGTPIPWGDIPARPWLGLADEDEQPVLEILERYLMGR